MGHSPYELYDLRVGIHGSCMHHAYDIFETCGRVTLHTISARAFHRENGVFLHEGGKGYFCEERFFHEMFVKYKN